MQERQRNPSAPALHGIAHESHFAPVIAGSADQHGAQQDALRARHGSSRSQTTHEACRTIRAVSRPKMESAVNTAGIVRGSRLALRGMARCSVAKLLGC